MTPSDVPEVVRIDTTAFSTPWSEETFNSLLKRSGVELWVAEWADELAAYAILWKVLDEGELANIAVQQLTPMNRITRKLFNRKRSERSILICRPHSERVL